MCATEKNRNSFEDERQRQREKKTEARTNDDEIGDDELYDAEADLCTEERLHYIDEIQTNATADVNVAMQHPIFVQGVNLCEMVHSISTAKNLTMSKMGDCTLSQIKAIVASINMEFPGARASKQKAKNIFLSYIKECHQKMDDVGESCPYYYPQIM